MAAIDADTAITMDPILEVVKPQQPKTVATRARAAATEIRVSETSFEVRK